MIAHAARITMVVIVRSLCATVSIPMKPAQCAQDTGNVFRSKFAPAQRDTKVTCANMSFVTISMRQIQRCATPEALVKTPEFALAAQDILEHTVSSPLAMGSHQRILRFVQGTALATM